MRAIMCSHVGALLCCGNVTIILDCLMTTGDAPANHDGPYTCTGKQAISFTHCVFSSGLCLFVPGPVRAASAYAAVCGCLVVLLSVSSGASWRGTRWSTKPT